MANETIAWPRVVHVIEDDDGNKRVLGGYFVSDEIVEAVWEAYVNGPFAIECTLEDDNDD